MYRTLLLSIAALCVVAACSDDGDDGPKTATQSELKTAVCEALTCDADFYAFVETVHGTCDKALDTLLLNETDCPVYDEELGAICMEESVAMECADMVDAAGAISFGDLSGFPQACSDMCTAK